MRYTLVKKEKNLTTFRNIKKQRSRKFYISYFNSNSYFSSLNYNLSKYFLKHQYINLNQKILNKLTIEEYNYIFSLNTWISKFYFKKY